MDNIVVYRGLKMQSACALESVKSNHLDVMAYVLLSHMDQDVMLAQMRWPCDCCWCTNVVLVRVERLKMRRGKQEKKIETFTLFVWFEIDVVDSWAKWKLMHKHLTLERHIFRAKNYKLNKQLLVTVENDIYNKLRRYKQKQFFFVRVPKMSSTRNCSLSMSSVNMTLQILFFQRYFFIYSIVYFIKIEVMMMLLSLNDELFFYCFAIDCLRVTTVNIDELNNQLGTKPHWMPLNRSLISSTRYPTREYRINALTNSCRC